MFSYRPVLKRFLCLALFLAAVPCTALDKFTLATNWKAEAEHGGFYQAIATGVYKLYGLDCHFAHGGAAGEQPAAAGRGLIK